jgi:hypothetical protein
LQIQSSPVPLKHLINHGSVGGSSSRSSSGRCTVGSAVAWAAEVVGHFGVKLIDSLGLGASSATRFLALAFGLAVGLALGGTCSAVGCGRLCLLLSGGALWLPLKVSDPDRQETR